MKSLVGKTTLFVLCVASVCAAVFGVILLVASYTSDRHLLKLFGGTLTYIPQSTVILCIAGFIVLAIASFIMLMYSAGRRPGSDELAPGFTENIPYDVMTAGLAVIAVFTVTVADRLGNSKLRAVSAVILIAAGISVVLGMCMTAASRLKQKTFFSKLFLRRICIWIKDLVCWIGRGILRFGRFLAYTIRRIPLVPKTTLVIVAAVAIELFLMLTYRQYRGSIQVGYVLLCWFIEKLILCPLILYVAISIKNLKKGGEALASGDYSYVTDTSRMLGDLKQHGENLNNIAVGMNRAVEDRLKSERMKTELITNVSHDIKTPLTSIINYAALIGEGKCDESQMKEYSEVLVRQSDKLKKLIEDLVEASKASTGNIEIIPAQCDASVFITQAAGEFEEKLRGSELVLITKLPEKELRINVDGRRMWRIFDNLLNNICKYSQPGTRVYLSLEESDKNAVFTFKNTSREPLDMTEAELMERFTRGDASRNTEGNGLGLSIAKSLTDLQGGSMNISVDGDLFKVVLAFPLIDF